MAEDRKNDNRVYPNNPEAEAAVLGAVLIDPEAANLLLEKLKEKDFFSPVNRTIFATMRNMHSQGKPIDTLTVADALDGEGKLDEIGSIDYLSDLAAGVISSANSEYYLEILKRDGLLRRVIEAGNSIVKSGYESQDGKDALAVAEKEVYSIAEQETDKELVRADKALGEVLSLINDAQVGKLPNTSVKTGYPTFDRLTKGLKPGELILIAARPSVGKTAFALNIAANAAREDKTVAIFSLEMAAPLLMKRMLAYESEVSFENMDRRGGLSTEQTDRLYKAYKRLMNAKIFIDDYSMNSPAEILSKCRRLKREFGLDLIIVDYLQLMHGNAKSSRGFESRQVEVSEMSRMMKVYARELDCPIVLLSQMSRNIDQRKTEPMLSDLRESGAIEQDADVVSFLHKPSQFSNSYTDTDVRLLIKKNRNGPLGEIFLEWTGETTTFKETVPPESDGRAKPEAPIQVTYAANQVNSATNQAKESADQGNESGKGASAQKSEEAVKQEEEAREELSSTDDRVCDDKDGAKSIAEIAEDMTRVDDDMAFDISGDDDDDDDDDGDDGDEQEYVDPVDDIPWDDGTLKF